MGTFYDSMKINIQILRLLSISVASRIIRQSDRLIKCRTRRRWKVLDSLKTLVLLVSRAVHNMRKSKVSRLGWIEEREKKKIKSLSIIDVGSIKYIKNHMHWISSINSLSEAPSTKKKKFKILELSRDSAAAATQSTHSIESKMCDGKKYMQTT